MDKYFKHKNKFYKGEFSDIQYNYENYLKTNNFINFSFEEYLNNFGENIEKPNYFYHGRLDWDGYDEHSGKQYNDNEHCDTIQLKNKSNNTSITIDFHDDEEVLLNYYDNKVEKNTIKVIKLEEFLESIKKIINNEIY